MKKACLSAVFQKTKSSKKSHFVKIRTMSGLNNGKMVDDTDS